MFHNYGFALSGIAQYALYLLNRLYQNDSTITQLKNLAAYVITETASQDGKVGGPVQIATISPTDGCIELDANETARIVADSHSRSETLKASFFERRTG
jgi:20S proteasome alpha/beta subunit